MDKKDIQVMSLTLVAAYCRLQELQVDGERNDAEDLEHHNLITWWQNFPVHKRAKVMKIIDTALKEDVVACTNLITKRECGEDIRLVALSAYGKMLELRVVLVINHINENKTIEDSKFLEFWWSDSNNRRRSTIISWVKQYADGYQIIGEVMK